MSILKRTVAGCLAMTAFVGAMSSLAPAAKADWRHDRWREHDRRVHEWRYHRWGAPYYYGTRTYVAPPVVYAPPPPSPGINLLFNVR